MKNKVLLIIIGIVIVIALSIFIPIIIKDQENKDKTQSQSSSTTEEIKLVINDDVVTDYYINEQFVYPTVYALYKDNQIKNVTDSNNLSITGFDLTKSGVQTVNIVFSEGKLSASYSYNIYVYSAKPKSIEAKYADEEIYWGEKINRDKLTVILSYNNGTKKQIYDYTLKYNSQPDDYGNNQLTVSYGEFSTTIYINVIEKAIDAKYSIMENEVISLLKKLGNENPTCPMDYSFEINVYGQGVIKTNGSLDYDESKINELYIFLGTSLLNEYVLDEGPVETYETIFPSIKMVYFNENLNISLTLYLYQNNDKIYYIMMIKEKTINN